MSSTRPFRFALQLVARPVDVLRDPVLLREAARRAEDLGYDEAYVADHIGSIDPFVVASMVAEATTTLRVGTLVLNNELHQPALLARSAATLDRLSGGRFVLGCGTGYQQSEHDATGIVLRPPKQRVDRFGECLDALRSLLDTGVAHIDGAHVTLAIDDLGVRPVQERLPLLVGGHGRRVVSIAARVADVFQFTGIVHALDGSASAAGFALDQVRERARWLDDAAGARSADIERSALVQQTVVADHVDLDALAAEFELPPEVVRDSPFLLAGSVTGIVDKLHSLRDELGISHVVVRDAVGFAPVVAALAGR